MPQVNISRRFIGKAQGLVEYALILALVALVAIGILAISGQAISKLYCSIVTSIGGSATCSGSVTVSNLSVSGASVHFTVLDSSGNTITPTSVSATDNQGGSYSCNQVICHTTGGPIHGVTVTVTANYNGASGSQSIIVT